MTNEASSAEPMLFGENVVQPSFLPVLDPNAPSEADACKRLLRICSEMYSRWFTLTRGCIQRERVRQQLFREEHGLRKRTRLPYERPVLTAAEESMVLFLEGVIRDIFGDVPADYAHRQFLRAISTGDIRTFKIRILLMKVRDSLQGGPLYKTFMERIESCISDTEAKSGCIPDPSKRRLSHAEKEHIRIREERKAALRAQQPELPLAWGNGVQHISITVSSQSPNLQDIGSLKTNVDVKSDICKVHRNNKRFRNATKTFRKSGKKNVVRKARDYVTVEEIMDDIHDGKITPYESMDEILKDIKARRISEVEAIMFTMALDIYKPVVSRDILYGSELESEFAQTNEGDETIEDDGVDEGAYEEEHEREGRRSQFSYNPNGFGGCAGGHYSGCGVDWNTDDE